MYRWLCILFCILLGVVLRIYVLPFIARKFEKKATGRFLISKTKEGKLIWRLDVDGDPEELINKKQITFKIYDCGIEEEESSDT